MDPAVFLASTYDARRRRWLAIMLFALALACPGPAFAGDADTAFATENNAAMARMMAAMEVKPSGNVERDFVAMMVPHHQGAIDMATAYLRHGDNEQLKRLAQEIIVEQQQEIAAMRLALGDPLPPSVAAPTQVASASVPSTRSPTPHGSAHGAASQATGTTP